MTQTRSDPSRNDADEMTLRTMKDADLDAVVDLSNRVLEAYAGTNVRTVEDFKWRCLDRPGVEPSGAFVVVCGSSIVGYSVVRTSGEVLDCIVDEHPKSRDILRTLLTESEEYAVAAGATRMLVNLPADRPDLRRVARTAGFAGSHATNLYLGAKNLPRLLELLHARSGAGGRCDIEFDVRAPLESEQTRFRLNCGVASEINEGRPKIRVTVSRPALSSILLSSGSVFVAAAKRELKVKPFVALPVVASVLRRLANSDPWFFNRSDIL